MIISYILEQETNTPLVTGIVFKSASAAMPVNKNQVLKLHAEHEKQKKMFDALPPPPVQEEAPDKRRDKPNTEWEAFHLGATDMEIKFPVEPKQTNTEITKDLHQHVSKTLTEDANGYLLTYFTSVVQSDRVSTIDSAAFYRTIATFNTYLRQTYKFEIAKEENIDFKGCKARSTRGNIQMEDGSSLQWDQQVREKDAHWINTKQKRRHFILRNLFPGEPFLRLGGANPIKKQYEHYPNF